LHPFRVKMPAMTSAAVEITVGHVVLEADLSLPARPSGLIVFAHGSGSSRHSRRNREVARVLNDASFATLLLDLLTAQEEAVDQFTSEYRFDIPRLGLRVVSALDWTAAREDLRGLRIGCFGASTGAAAALIAAADRPGLTAAVVSRGGRPDLAGDALPRVIAPTLLIVGGNDEPVIQLNEEAMKRMTANVRLEIVPGATHLFEEAGAMDHVSRLAIDWFTSYVGSQQ